MLIVERQSRLLEIIKRKQVAELAELCKELDVSISTVRRDLETMEERGVVQRTHGGVIYRGELGDKSGPVNALASRMNENIAAKDAIARYAASLVQPHMTVFMDAGSTVIFAARAITVRPIQVVTTSLSIANHYVDDDRVELTLTGGNLYPRTGAMVGTLARKCLSELHADLCLFSLAAIDEQAAYNINLEMARVEQMMMQRANRTVMLMDATKFGRKSLVKVCGLGEVDLTVTDASIDKSWVDRLGDGLVVAT
ncbi:MAG: DeoR/GlpR family DNA-binding transcription regulator [Phycisphaerales bacterium]